MYQYPGFLFVNSDLFNHTPNLAVELLRDQAKTYGVSETRILNLLHNAYSQNYVYLIKKPNDQYQVILEVDGRRPFPARGPGSALHQERRRAADGSAACRGHWHTIARAAVGESHQPVHQRDAFLQPETRCTRSVEATDFIENAAKEIVPPGMQGGLQGEALTFRDTVYDLTMLMVAGCVRDVRDPGDSVRELSASDDGALVAAGGAGRRAADAVRVRRSRLRSTRSSACSC